ncbi:protein rep [uncultured Brachyspira sp.]|uniref:protein rep n=1 Tax=uncultured Brachyspira sp. TaxID=221953 RepID=UPI00262FA28D|nr:protein rep [uncultured Brachyspira sp.]
MNKKDKEDLELKKQTLIETYEYLSEITSENFMMSNYYMSKSDRLKDCKKRHWCRVKLCPVCNFYRQLKVSKNLTKIMDYLAEDYNFFFITLTIKNCQGKELSDKLSEMMKAWNKFVGHQTIKSSFIGWYRWIETTYNIDKKTYHPHLHIIAATPNENIDKKEFQSQWKKTLCLNYDPVIDITKVRNLENMPNYVIEVEKNKNEEYWIGMETYSEIVAVLDDVLDHRRISGWGGEMKKLKKLFKEV